jgi:hypothetical protein
MTEKEITNTIRAISMRSLPDGGFYEQPDSLCRADSTAWAILALKSMDTHSSLIESARSSLASQQLDDGRICISREHPQVIWPTSLVILAWQGSVAYRKKLDMAIHFLIKTKGTFFKKSANSIHTIDSSLAGWPWIEKTFSWVEPTALSVLALRLSSCGNHERVHEAIRLLMDRQLPRGGWNIGSTIIYGQETYPQLDCTGLALSALAGQVDKKEIERSLAYLKAQIVRCRTPLSLCWALFGLGAWGERPTEAQRWIIDCLSQQTKFGTYGRTLLSLIVLAHRAKGGFLETIS